MKYVILAMLLNGQQAEFGGAFKDSISAASFKTQLFAYNKHKNGSQIKKQGWNIPTNWAEYDKKVYVKGVN